MTLLSIVQPPNPTLRRRARPVTRIDDHLQQLIDDMIETMRQVSGVGLAAPQVDQSLRLAVIETLPETDEDGNDIPDSRELHVIINPEITWKSRKTIDGYEGCLSIPGYIGEVSRHEAIRVQGLDRHGRKFNLRLKDWTARIFQHEIDHLDGILYIDRLTDSENFWTDEEFAARHTGNEDDEEPEPVVGD
jgi:peptide deformylase